MIQNVKDVVSICIQRVNFENCTPFLGHTVPIYLQSFTFRFLLSELCKSYPSYTVGITNPSRTSNRHLVQKQREKEGPRRIYQRGVEMGLCRQPKKTGYTGDQVWREERQIDGWLYRIVRLASTLSRLASTTFSPYSPNSL